MTAIVTRSPQRTSPAFRARIAAITIAPQFPAAPHARPPASLARRLALGAVLVALVSIGGWGLVRVARRPAAEPPQAMQVLETPAAGVPLLGDALADYRRVVAGDLPGRARDLAAVRVASRLPVEPLRADGLRLLGAWTTELEGEPAAVLAYRWKDRLLVQYIVPEPLFFRSPAIRAAAAAHRRLALADGAQGIVAWPVTAAGTVLIGDGAPDRIVEALDR